MSRGNQHLEYIMPEKKTPVNGGPHGENAVLNIGDCRKVALWGEDLGAAVGGAVNSAEVGNRSRFARHIFGIREPRPEDRRDGGAEKGAAVCVIPPLT